MTALTPDQQQAAREAWDSWIREQTGSVDYIPCFTAGFAAGMSAGMVLKGQLLAQADAAIERIAASPTTGGSDAEVAGLVKRLEREYHFGMTSTALSGMDQLRALNLLNESIHTIDRLTATLAERTAEVAKLRDALEQAAATCFTSRAHHEYRSDPTHFVHAALRVKA